MSDDGVNYKNYCLLDRSQINNEKTAAKTGKYFNRVKILIILYTFDDKDPIKALRFLRGCNFNEVSEERTLWVSFNL